MKVNAERCGTMWHQQVGPEHCKHGMQQAQVTAQEQVAPGTGQPKSTLHLLKAAHARTW